MQASAAVASAMAVAVEGTAANPASVVALEMKNSVTVLMPRHASLAELAGMANVLRALQSCNVTCE